MNAQMLTLLRGSLANRGFSLVLIVVTLGMCRGALCRCAKCPASDAGEF